MSRNEARPKSAFSLRYLATQKLEVSLRSATAVAMLGSFLSKLIVVLTLLITASVSFTYSSSEAANAAETGDMKRLMADRERRLRRQGRNDTTEAEGVASAALGRSDSRGLAVVAAVVGVIRVGEAMVEER